MSNPARQKNPAHTLAFSFVQIVALLAAMKLGILGSGTGSNMLAIDQAINDGHLDAEIVLVMSDVPDALILERASQRGIATETIDCRGYPQRFPLDAQAETAEALQKAGVDLVCLAGFMRLIKSPLLTAFPQRIINIHPSLLPAFPGLAAWEQALDAGASETGCTVHFVDDGMDTGPAILQARVPVMPDDTAASLHARIQVEEHRIYPLAIQQIIDSRRS